MGEEGAAPKLNPLNSLRNEVDISGKLKRLGEVEGGDASVADDEEEEEAGEDGEAVELTSPAENPVK